MAHETLSSGGPKRAKLADYFLRPLTHVGRSIWALLHDADRDKDLVTMVTLTSSQILDHLHADGALVVLKGGTTVELFHQWAVRMKILTPGKGIVDRGEPSLPLTHPEPPAPEDKAAREAAAKVVESAPAKDETQRLQALMDAAAKLDTLGVVVRHRGYDMRLSFEPADEEHPWVAVGHVEFPADGEPTDVSGYGDTAEEALENCAEEIESAEDDIYAEDPDEPEDGEDEDDSPGPWASPKHPDETTTQWLERMEREGADFTPVPPGHFIHDPEDGPEENEGQA